MTSESDIREALHAVEDPVVCKPLEELGMISSFELRKGEVTVQVRLPVPNHPSTGEISQRINWALEPLPDVKKVNVRFELMGEEQRNAFSTRLHQGIPFTRQDSRTSVIGVSSGKGGVGKSTVSTNLAAALVSLGHKVGIMDADIWGFSVPRMLGLRGQRPLAFSGKIVPLDRRGLKVISIGFFLESEEQAVVWRGPMLHKALEQFLSDVLWPDNLDYLIIDLPPGTGDISLSLTQFLPGMGMVVVTTPQPVAQKVAERAANMAVSQKLRLLGVVENMSGVICEHCNKVTAVFGEGGGAELAETLEVPLLGQIPLIAAVREQADAGEPFVWAQPEHPVTSGYLEMARAVAKFRPRRRLPVV